MSTLPRTGRMVGVRECGDSVATFCMCKLLPARQWVGWETNKKDCINLWSSGERGGHAIGTGWLRGHPIIRLLSALLPGD